MQRTLSHRELTLIILFGVVVLGWGLYSVFRDQFLNPLRTMQVEVEQWEHEAPVRKQLEQELILAESRYEDFVSRSLPQDRNRAIAILQNAILNQASELGLGVPNLTPSLTSESLPYLEITISLDCQLDEAITFMHAIDLWPVVHRWQRIQLEEVSRRTETSIQALLTLEVLAIQAEAMSSEMTAALLKPDGNLKNNTSLFTRHPFRPSTNTVTQTSPTIEEIPDEPETVEPIPQPPIQRYRFVGVLSRNQRSEAMLIAENSKERQYVTVGSTLAFHDAQASVVGIGTRELQIRQNGQIKRIGLGELVSD